MRTYEVMYLLDNETVRAGWSQAKSGVAALVAKHGGKVLSARRWEERQLAYPIRRRRRGTYLLSYVELEAPSVAGLRRELDLTESVLRYLILQAEAVPTKELELTQVEAGADFVVPMPPSEDEPEPEDETQPTERAGKPERKSRGADRDDSEDDESSEDADLDAEELEKEEV